MSSSDGGTPGLKRALGLWPLVFFGLGTIIGAGIYVLVGEVARVAGPWTPLSFLLAAALAGLTGLSYAELVTRYPEAAGAAAFVAQGLRSDWAGRLVGLAVALVAGVAAASIASGSIGYIQAFVPLPREALLATVIGGFTVIACFRVTESVGVAALMSVIEVGGLVIVVAIGLPALGEWPARLAEMPAPADIAVTASGIGAGAFIAFFAFIGFETLANMAEETREVGRTLPRAILISIALAALLYGLVSLVSVAAVPLAALTESEVPLALVAARAGPAMGHALTAIAIIATTNGVLIEIVMMSRLAYGMARRGWVPPWLGVVNPRTRAPARASLAAGAFVALLAFAVPFEHLVAATSSITLAIFVAVNLALWRLKRREPRPELPFRAPTWLPLAAAGASALLFALQLLG